jgi:hypothetical protein
LLEHWLLNVGSRFVLADFILGFIAEKASAQASAFDVMSGLSGTSMTVPPLPYQQIKDFSLPSLRVTTTTNLQPNTSSDTKKQQSTKSAGRRRV